MLIYGDGSVGLSTTAWALDLAASTATAVWAPQGAGSSPEGHRTAHGVWDIPRSRLVVQGGVVESGVANFFRTADLWELVPGASPAWTMLMPNTLPPPATTGFAAAVDTAGDRMILYGGGSTSTDTWTRALGVNEGWLRASTIGPAGYQWTGAADLAGARMIALGTYPAVAIDAFDFLPGTWQPLPNSSPPHDRGDPFVAFDDAQRRFYLYGGIYTDYAANHNVWLDDTWEYDVVAGTWQELAGAGSFGSRFGAAGIYDPVRNRLIAFGGQDSVGRRGDLHQLALGGSGTWAPLSAAGTPPPASDSDRAAYDPVGDRMIVFSPSADVLKVWALDLAEPASWSLLSPAGRLPFSRLVEQPVYDAKRRRILLHGGRYEFGVANDTWAFYLDDTTPTMLSLVDALVEANRVRIRWYSGETVHGAATVLRRVDGAEWSQVGTIAQDGTGMLVYEDRDVAAGQRLDYKLRVGGEEFGDVHATIPGVAGVLRLSGPNPAIGAPRITFELAGTAPARLELFDIAGRRVFEKRLDGVGAGVLTLARQAPGVYFVRLVQGGNEVRRKIMITD
jgi:hypothetical protein